MPDTLMSSGFGKRLRLLRERANMTQRQVAAAADMALSAVAKLEQGKGEPKWNTVRVLAKALGVSVAEFDVDEPTEEKPKKGKPKK